MGQTFLKFIHIFKNWCWIQYIRMLNWSKWKKWNFIHTESMSYAYFLNLVNQGGLGMFGNDLDDTIDNFVTSSAMVKEWRVQRRRLKHVFILYFSGPQLCDKQQICWDVNFFTFLNHCSYSKAQLKLQCRALLVGLRIKQNQNLPTQIISHTYVKIM